MKLQNLKLIDWLWMGATRNIATMPITPAHPISFHTNVPMKIVSKGPIQIWFKKNKHQSNALTSFDSRFTTFPVDVSPNAVCDNRSDWNEIIY